MAKHILRGPSHKVEIPNCSLGEYMWRNISVHGTKIAQVDAVTGKQRTYDDIIKDSIALAETMRGWGVKKGDVVAIMSPNCTEFCLPVLASLYLGATLAPLNPTYTPRELQHAMSISKPCMLFCHPLILPKVPHVLAAVSFVKKVVVFGDRNHDYIKFSDCIDKPKSYVFNCVQVDPRKDLSAILCSSGTTGLPKGVMINHRSIIATIEMMRDPDMGHMTGNDVHLGLLPLFHAYAFFTQFCTLALGVKSIILPKFEEQLFLESIQNHKVTLMMLVPPLMVFLAKHPLVDNYDLSSIRAMWCGAAPLSPEIQEQVSQRIQVPSIRQGYGMTEMTLAALITPPDEHKIGSSGKLLHNLEAKVVDLETGQTLGPNQKGELCFRGETIMLGYCGDEQSTQATIDKDGFLHSGDIGYYDEDGYFFIIDRKKELIKYKGFQVPPAELEAILLTHPSIKDAAVIGVPDIEAGELPRAFVVKQPGAVLSEDHVIDFVASQVSPAKRLHGGVKFISEIPKNPTGKILRRVLRESLKSNL
ncbi:hypothetical protein R5R35_001997 [Gryllus longicercus]|uniref:Luciferin 4-monooxygenase n=1 Tax=Gryllus longicercus TaxID=2509291 RepID=A0AAN9VS55_9ORTH